MAGSSLAARHFGGPGTPVKQAGTGIVGGHVKEDVTAPAGCRGGNEVGEQGCPDALTLVIVPHRDRLDVAPPPAKAFRHAQPTIAPSVSATMQ